jgi:hypothetical protein
MVGLGFLRRHYVNVYEFTTKQNADSLVHDQMAVLWYIDKLKK